MSILEKKICSESKVILDNVDFYERELNKKILQLDDPDYNTEEIQSQILHLVGKLDKEIDNMDAFMEKYRKILNEEKKLLSRNCRIK